MPPKSASLDLFKTLKAIHPFLNTFSQYITYLTFVILAIQTFIKLNRKQATSSLSILNKWLLLALLKLCQKYISHLSIGSLIVCIASIILVVASVHGYSIKKKIVNGQQQQQQDKVINQSKIVFKIAKILLKNIPNPHQYQSLWQSFEEIEKIFYKSREIRKVSSNQTVESQRPQIESQKPQLFTTFGQLRGVDVEVEQKQQEKDKSQETPEHNMTKKKTLNSEEISAIIKPNSQLQTLLSPNQDILVFHFDDASKSNVWGDFISKPQSIPQQIQQLSQDPPMIGFNCDQMIRLTKKSFEFFRQAIISRGLQGIQIMVKNNSDMKRKLLANFNVKILTDQIIELSNGQSQRFFRFQNNEALNNFHKYIKQI